jgi:FtsH-binding integral membrane protein
MGVIEEPGTNTHPQADATLKPVPHEPMSSQQVYGHPTESKHVSHTSHDYQSYDMPEAVSVPVEEEPRPRLTRPPSRFGQTLMYTGSHEFRAAFVRKVYTLLSMQMLLTVGVMCLCMFNTALRKSIVNSVQTWLMISIIISFVFMFALFFLREKHPVNYFVFFGFTLALAFQVGVIGAICAEAGLSMVALNAGVVTFAVFVSLTVFTMFSKADFSWMQAGLFCGLHCMILWGLFAMITGFQRGYWYSLIGTLLFCGFIIYDTWRITTVYGYDDFLLAAMDLYLDIINLFIYILQLFLKERR